MKKLLALLFVTLLLFTACKEEVKPKEVETPIDVEENTEIETPTQNEEPTNIENPVEVEKATLTFVSNEKTFTIPLEIPREYIEPNIVLNNEFNWGNYFPILSYSVKDEEKANHIHANVLHNAILNDEISSLNDGKEKYNLMSGKKEFSSAFVEANNLTDFEVTIKYGAKKQTSKEVLGFFEDRYLILKIFYPDKFLSVLYLCDFELNVSKVLILQSTQVSVSPDGKYIIYSSPYADGWGLSDAKIEGEIQKGFYIRNLQTDQTVFFSCQNVCNPYCIDHSILGWISKEKYKKLTESQE